MTDFKKGRTTNWTVTSRNRHEWKAIEEAKVRPFGNVGPTKKKKVKKEEKEEEEEKKNEEEKEEENGRRRKRRRRKRP